MMVSTVILALSLGLLVSQPDRCEAPKMLSAWLIIIINIVLRIEKLSFVPISSVSLAGPSLDDVVGSRRRRDGIRDHVRHRPRFYSLVFGD